MIERKGKPHCTAVTLICTTVSKKIKYTNSPHVNGIGPTLPLFGYLGGRTGVGNRRLGRKRGIGNVQVCTDQIGQSSHTRPGVGGETCDLEEPAKSLPLGGEPTNEWVGPFVTSGRNRVSSLWACGNALFAWERLLKNLGWMVLEERDLCLRLG